MTIRILLVDDHTLFRESLRLVLEKEQDFQVVGEAGNATEALEMANNLSPDLVIMDIGMPGMNGIDATQRLTAAHPGLRVLAVSAFLDKHFVVQMREAGAAGYVQKSAGRGELIQAIRAVSQGKSYLSQDVAALLADSAAGTWKFDGKTMMRLGKRETDVLRLLADGLTSADIAERLHIATSTVDVHRRNMMKKLDLHSIAALTRYAVRIGLVND